MNKLIDADALKNVFRQHYPINYKILANIIDDMPDERTARVLTPAEVKRRSGYVWLEIRGNTILDVKLIYRGYVRRLGEDPVSVSLLNWQSYGDMWRYWSAQPTDEQREAEVWA